MKPVLIGRDNPYSKDPKHALYPLPRHATGWNLYQLLKSKTDCTLLTYVHTFDRRDLTPSPWSKTRGRWAAALMHEEFKLNPRPVVLVGRDVADAFNLKPKLVVPTIVDGVSYHQIPHTSGRNRAYDEPTLVALVSELLAQLYRSEHAHA